MRVCKLVGVLIVFMVSTSIGTALAVETLWRWLPGAEKTKFTGKTGKVILQIKSGPSIVCPNSETSGEITTGLTLGLSTIHLLACKTGGLPTQSLGDPKEIILMHAELHNCLTKAGALGLLFKTLEMHVEIPSTKLLFIINGSFVALLSGTKGFVFGLTVEQKEGKQSIEKCEGGEADTLLASTDGGAFVQTGEGHSEGFINFIGVEQEAMES